MEYRITKYNPNYRNELGHYKKDEWTSISDVGRYFDENLFTLNEYYETENNYINCVKEIIKLQKLDTLKIKDYENPFGNNLKWSNKMIIKNDDIENIMQDCLREKCWCRIVSKNFFIHFGYYC